MSKEQVGNRLVLPPEPRLSDFHRYIDDMVRERGFNKETVPELLMHFLEESGEMARAFRHIEHGKISLADQRAKLAEELADVFILLLCLANKANIDLEEAFRAKEVYNNQRDWSLYKK